MICLRCSSSQTISCPAHSCDILVDDNTVMWVSVFALYLFWFVVAHWPAMIRIHRWYILVMKFEKTKIPWFYFIFIHLWLVKRTEMSPRHEQTTWEIYFSHSIVRSAKKSIKCCSCLNVKEKKKRYLTKFN